MLRSLGITRGASAARSPRDLRMALARRISFAAVLEYEDMKNFKFK